jgi:hypothetical protein
MADLADDGCGVSPAAVYPEQVEDRGRDRRPVERDNVDRDLALY